jgi:hypothetical protein
VRLCLLAAMASWILFFPEVSAQTVTYRDTIYAPKIHSVKVRSTKWEFSPPVYELGSDDRLELIFDDLAEDRQDYDYTLVHCDADWKQSSLQPQEYLDGMGEGSIRESAHSYNTTYPFNHFRLEFPENDCMPQISGNYALVVYEAGNRDAVVLVRRVYVVEKKVQATGEVRPSTGNQSETSQQVTLEISYSGFRIQDPARDIIVVIRQNGRDDNALYGMKPSAFVQGKLEYRDPSEGMFKGGNEYRTLDLKSMKYQRENMSAIDFRNPYYHVILKPDKSRDGNPYFSIHDLNGQYFIEEEKARDKHLEADYVYVHFSLEQPYPLPEDVYITGELTGWASSPLGKMEYHAETQAYEATLLLKQGLYDYSYCTVDPKTGEKNEEIFEGSYSETSNDYQIYIYLHDSGSKYDELIGYLPLSFGSH